MMADEIPDIPGYVQRLYRRFEPWRSADTGRLPIPERLWTAAAELARRAWTFLDRKGSAFRVWQAQGAGGGGGSSGEEARGVGPFG